MAIEKEEIQHKIISSRLFLLLIFLKNISTTYLSCMIEHWYVAYFLLIHVIILHMLL